MHQELEGSNGTPMHVQSRTHGVHRMFSHSWLTGLNCIRQRTGRVTMIHSVIAEMYVAFFHVTSQERFQPSLGEMDSSKRAYG